MFKKIHEVHDCDEYNVLWKKHALQRMMERGILRQDVKNALKDGVVIEYYYDDYPYPSFLIAYVDTLNPLHIVCSIDDVSKTIYIITAYTPDTDHFESDLLTRRNDNEK